MVNTYQQRQRDRFYRVLLEQNLKLTKPRKALIDLLLRKRNWHFQANELLQELIASTPGVVSRATIYRTLELLVRTGILIKSRVHENSYRYELADTEGHHHHLVDINTGKVVEFADDRELHRMLRRVEKQFGFRERYHLLEVFGEFERTARRKPAPQRVARRTRK